MEHKYNKENAIKNIVLLRVSITNYHQLSALYKRNLLSHSSGGQKSEISKSARLFLLWRLWGGDPFLVSSSFWWLPGISWLSLACGCISLVTAPIFTLSFIPCVCQNNLCISPVRICTIAFKVHLDNPG